MLSVLFVFIIFVFCENKFKIRCFNMFLIKNIFFNYLIVIFYLRQTNSAALFDWFVSRVKS